LRGRINQLPHAAGRKAHYTQHTTFSGNRDPQRGYHSLQSAVWTSAEHANTEASLLQKFGTLLKERCQRTVADIYVGKEALPKQIPLWPSWKKPLDNGGLHRYLTKYKIR